MTEPNPADVLEPCPFCGHDVKLVDRKELFVFSCPDHSPCIGVGFATYGKQDQRETAIAAWNTRAALQQSRSAVIEECAKKVEEVWLDGEPYSECADWVRALSQESANA